MQGDALQRNQIAKWKTVALSSLVERVADPVRVVPHETYREIGVRSHGKGIFHKEPVIGASLGDKRVYRVHPNCFVFNVVFAWEQAVALTSESECGMIASHRFPMYRPRDGRVALEFLLAFFKTDAGKYLLGLASPGGAGRNRTLSQSGFLKTRIPCPPLPEQRKIAAILQTWDRAIELTERLVAAERNRKQALMQQLLTGKVRLRKFAQDVKWKVAELGKIAILSSGGTPSKTESRYWCGTIPWITAKDLKRLHLADSRDHVSKEAIGNGTRLMPAGTVFILVRGMTLLKDVPVCIASVPMAFNQDIRALAVQEGYDPRFVAYALVAGRSRLLSLVNVAGHGTGRLATELLVELPVKLPTTTEEQAAVADVIEAAEREETSLNARLELLQLQKKGLMQQLLTGRVRVRTDAEAAVG